MLKKFMGPFVVTFLICVFALLMQFLWVYLDDIIGKGLPGLVIVELMVYAASNLIPLAMPLTVLIASIMTFGNLGETNELLAIKAAGISLGNIIKPLVILSFLLMIGAFMFSNYVLPDTNKKFWTLLYSARQQRPEVGIDAGVFTTDIDGFAIKVESKDESGLLRDILIYDHRESTKNDNVIVADSGRMNLTEDKSYMVLTLYNGENYKEGVEKKNKRRKDRSYPFRRDQFTKQVIVTPMDGLDFNRKDESLFSNSYATLSISSLRVFADSLKTVVGTKAKKYYGRQTSFRISRQLVVHSTTDLDSIKNSKVKKALGDLDLSSKGTGSDSVNDSILPRTFNVDSIYDSAEMKDQRALLLTAINTLKDNISTLNFSKGDIEATSKAVRKYDLECQRKFALSFACFMFFFIGAPLGALIRKGGMGYPLVISIILYISYYVLGMISEKMGLEGVIPVWRAMWTSSALFSAAGVLLTIAVVKDKAIGWSSTMLSLMEKLRLRKRIK